MDHGGMSSPRVIRRLGPLANQRPATIAAVRKLHEMHTAARVAARGDALRKLAPPDVETALAFFAMEFGGRVGVHQLVLETEAGADVVLKLDFDERAWKRVRKKTRPPPAEASI